MTTTERELEGLSLCDLGERIQGASYVLATVSGLDEAAKLIRDKAGAAFASNQDREASLYRDLAAEVEALSKRTRKEFDEQYKPRERAAFEELEARDRAKE